MKKLEGYSSRIKRLSELVAQLENGKLTVEELSEMELVTRELHERSIILRYNAFKNQVMPESDMEADDGAIFDKSGGVEVEVIIEEIDDDEEEAQASDRQSSDDQTSDIQTHDEEPIIDFSIFDEEPEVIFEPVIEKTPEPDVIPTPKPVEPKFETEPIEVIAEPSSMSAQSFLDKLKVEDNSVASRFTHSKLDSLIGAFGLNERLRYINDLFDGSSELFSDAIKALDSQSSLDQANLKAATLATDNNWDPEEEIVIEFMSYLNRRYA